MDLTKEQRLALTLQWGGALLKPDGVKKGMFRQFVGTLADLELEQAMENRLALWRLQDILGQSTTKSG